MPLNATFVADFNSFLDATAKAVQATDAMTAAASKTGPVYDQLVGNAAAASGAQAAAADKVQEDYKKFGEDLGKGLIKAGEAVGEFASHYLDAFGQAEQATARLSTALKNADAEAGTLKIYQDLAEDLSHISTYSVDALTNVETLLTTSGNIKPDNMEATLKAVMDLTAGMAGSGLSLESAAKLVAKAAASDGESLGRLSSILGYTVSKGDDLTTILDAIEKKFGGEAVANADTYAGSIKNLGNQFDLVNAKIGGLLAPPLEALDQYFKSLPKGVQEFVVGLIDIASHIGPVLETLAALAQIASTEIGGAVFAALGAALGALVPWLLIVGAALVAFYEIWKHWGDLDYWLKTALDAIQPGLSKFAPMLEKWYADAKAIFGKIPALFDGWVAAAESMITGLTTWLVTKLGALFDQAVSIVATGSDKVRALFQGLEFALVGGSIVPDMIDGIAEQFLRLPDVMVNPTQQAAQAVQDLWNGLGDSAAGLLPLMFGGTPIDDGGTRAIFDGSTLPTPSAGLVRMPSMFAAPGQSVINISMNGMMGTDDPQTRAALRSVISDALMDGMRSTRLMGTT
jgi:hypothetical protein